MLDRHFLILEHGTLHLHESSLVNCVLARRLAFENVKQMLQTYFELLGVFVDHLRSVAANLGWKRGFLEFLGVDVLE